MRTALQIAGCPLCHRPLDPVIEEHGTVLTCPKDRYRFPIRDGLPWLVPPDRIEEADQVARAMTEIRRLEGWGELPAESLLEPTVGGPPLLCQWRRSLTMLASAVEREHWRLGRKLRIATVGGGVHHDAAYFARQGHSVLAVDPSPDPQVGVLSARRLSHQTSQAAGVAVGLPELPPLQEGGPDLVILRGWLGVPTNPRPLLQRIVTQVLPPGGLLLIADMPVFKQSLAIDRWLLARVARYREELGLAEDMSRRVAPISLWKVVPSLERIDCQVEVRTRWGFSARWTRSIWAKLMGVENPRTPLILVRAPGDDAA